MREDVAQDLRRVLGLMKAENLDAARPILLSILRRDPDSEQAWYMLSLVIADPQRQAYSLRQVIRVNPANEKARQRLDKLLGVRSVSQPVPAPPAPSEPSAQVAAEPRFDIRGALGLGEKKDPWALDSEAPFDEAPDAGDQLLTSRLVGGDDTLAVPTPKEAPVASPLPDDRGTRPLPPETAGMFDDEITTALAAEREGAAVKRRISPRTLIVSVIVIAVASGLFLSRNQILAAIQGLRGSGVSGESPTATPTESNLAALPATWTATAPLPTSTPPPVGTPRGVNTPTPQPLAPEIQRAVATVQAQVSTLRGLSSERAINSYIASSSRAVEILQMQHGSSDFQRQLDDQAIALAALGLIPENYDLLPNALNAYYDAPGGLYLSSLGEIHVVGLAFTGVEKSAYAHLYAHALVDETYSVGAPSGCLGLAEECKALRALVEGDAVLLAERWLARYATAAERAEVQAVQPTYQLVTEPTPPAFILADLAFPYVHGLDFVEGIGGRSSLSSVNNAYSNAPSTTEQILHPDKYRDGEQALAVDSPDLATELDSGWRMVYDGSLGEWVTYSILRLSVFVTAQLTEDLAISASEGWGGDRAQVFYNDQLRLTAMAVHWAWDTPEDAVEFSSALSAHLERRYTGADYEQTGASCWQSETEISCILTRDDEIIWLLVPDADILESLIALFP